MEDDVKGFFDKEHNEGGYGEEYLKVFRTEFCGGHRLHAPLRGGTLTEAPNPPDCVEIDQGASQSQQHHRNADPVGV